MRTETLPEGNYSAFALSDDGTWEQPTYRVPKGLTEGELERAIMRDTGAFIVFGIQEDRDCPEEYVRELHGEAIADED